MGRSVRIQPEAVVDLGRGRLAQAAVAWGIVGVVSRRHPIRNDEPTDEYDIYTRLKEWGCHHKTVSHSAGKYARDEDGDGFHEVRVNTLEGFWSLLRSWLRPHRGISQEKLPLYLGFFEFVHNARRRGKALLAELLAMLVAP